MAHLQGTYSKPQQGITFHRPDGRCPLWVNRVTANSRRNPPLSVVSPIGDKTWCRRFVREVPEADIPPLHSITTSARSSFVLALMIGDDSIKMVSSLRRVKRSLSFQKGSVSVVTSGSPSITRRCGGLSFSRPSESRG
jgi:hypothetical protein